MSDQRAATPGYWIRQCLQSLIVLLCRSYRDQVWPCNVLDIRSFRNCDHCESEDHRQESKYDFADT